MNVCTKFAWVIGTVAGIAGTALAVPPSVLTQDYDMTRSGANLAETVLTPANVSASTFGKLFEFPADEEVWAQPLYLPGLAIAGGTHNVVFVATQGNSVFAFDADNPATASTPLWSVNLGAPVPASKFNFTSTGVSHAGIYSTPVIDTNLGALYVVTEVWNSGTQTVSMLLHALSITTGQELFGGPVNVTAPGFDPGVNEQLGGLLLLNGIVYLPIASHGDVQTNMANLQTEPYFGYVLAYNASSLAEVGAFNVEPGGAGGGIWQGGRGLASDGSYIYAQVANEFTVGTSDYSETFLQLNPVNLTLNGYFRDPNAACMNKLDLDLASSGPQVIPVAGGTNLLVGGGKQGKLWTLQLNQPLGSQSGAYIWGTADHLLLPADGGTCADKRTQSHGWIQGSDTAFWNNPSGNSYYYAFGSYDNLTSWQLSGSTFTNTSTDTPVSTHPNALAVSANGGTNGILWAVAPQAGGSADFSAYNAVPSGGHLTLLWSSTQTPTRDVLGTLGRFSVPTVANGKVYVGSGANQVAVYGLLPTAPSVTVTAASPTLNASALNNLSEPVYVRPAGGYKGTVTLSISGLPAGVTASFSKPSVVIVKNTVQVTDTLTVSPADAVLPLHDNYTLLITAAGTGGVTASVPIRLLMRNAAYTAHSSAGCNAQDQLSANLAWNINGMSAPSIYVQDSVSPNWPGRLWTNPGDGPGSGQTPYVITGAPPASLWWIIDQSTGIAPIIDNAITNINLRPLYKCP